MLTAAYLKEMAQKGIFAGPAEDERSFVKRIDMTKNLPSHPDLKQFAFEPWKENLIAPLGVALNWVPLTYSNKKLLPWQGGALWVFGEEKLPMVQLRKKLKSGRLLFYSEKEILLHEATHALRARFDEPRFEEILAYFHSSSRFRRFFGPIFRRSREVYIFLSLIFASLLVMSSSAFFLASPLLPLFQFALVLPLFDLLLRTVKLIKDQRILKKALKKIQDLFPSTSPFSAALMLTDSEIEAFAIKPPKVLFDMIETKISTSLRWRQILAIANP
ncbi:MAG: hypothetical protein KDK60_00990 [Chlamydiia bacterium]|nr:hypothetical protein [Chlamydiia bacterium]